MKSIYTWLQQFFHQCLSYTDTNYTYANNTNQIMNHHIIDIDKRDNSLLTPDMLKRGIVCIPK